MVTTTANGKSLVISPKYAIMVCQYIRGRKLSRAKAILEAAIARKEAIPFTRFNDGVGHRVGIAASGRYPVKACEAILGLLNSAEANGTNKGMTGDLIVKEIRANRASAPMRYGRQSRRKGKRTHVHVTLEELEAKRVTKATKVTEIKTEKPVKSESKPAKAESKPVEKPATKTEKKPEAVNGN